VARRPAYETIIVERRGPVGWLIFNRPTARNALNRLMDEEIQRAWRELDDERAVRVIVNTGRGPAYQTGIDLREVAADRSDPRPDGPAEGAAGATVAPRAETQRWHTARDCRVRKPVICAVNGRCDGLGFHFLAESDVVVAASDATFVDSHVSLGLISAMEPLSLMPRIGFGPAMRMVLMGRHEVITAARAYELGLVTQVVDPPWRLEEETQALAEKIATNSPSAMEASKRAIWHGVELGLAGALDDGWRIIHTSNHHPDFTEGSRAFVEKRAPVWQDLPPRSRQGGDDTGER
jgi:enoyl-CoA hydratase/carnithine racemase